MPIAESIVGRTLLLIACLVAPVSAMGQDDPGMKAMPTTADRPDHIASEMQHEGQNPPDLETPPLPEGMTLDEVLDRAASAPPAGFPDPVPDDRLWAFTLVDQLEYRVADESIDELGWEADSWFGTDYDKLWLKTEGAAVFEGADVGESENDLLYARLIRPFWYAQAGVQYANDWTSDDYNERWSAVVALQGMARYMFEVDASLYLSDDADVTATLEAEYDLRLTQRLVLQPRTELLFAAQDVEERDLGAGLARADFDLRLRYEVSRKFAPYVGVRYTTLVDQTADRADAAGEETEEFLALFGVRLAF